MRTTVSVAHKLANSPAAFRTSISLNSLRYDVASMANIATANTAARAIGR
ncbi:hypothetical protein [Anaerobacillus sp. 1_MG-2023]|nr:hypothetical protein [Anaerobacillus sp. 1_MG-2023]MDO6658892.1 hypothetical protein [Anaerobacillus sp. 1_MG-2023]